MQLFDYQKEGIDFLLKNKKVYLAFDMGMGKTLTSLAAMIKTGKNVLVVAELNEIENSKNFEKEVTNFFPTWKYFSLREHDVEDLPDSRVVAGVNPDRLAKLDIKMVAKKFGAIIVDEATLAKTMTTIRFKQIKKVCDAMEYLILLSGTPMMNGASEIYAPLLLVDHSISGEGMAADKKAFETIFAGGHLRQIKSKEGLSPWYIKRYYYLFYTWWAKGANNVRELRYLIEDKFLFKRKSESTSFKKKERLIINVPMTPEWSQEYAQAWADYMKTVEDHNLTAPKKKKKSVENITELQNLIENGQMYQVNSKWKAKRVAKDIAEGLYGDRRVIVFSSFIETDELLQSELKRYGISFRVFDEISDWKKGDEKVLVGRIRSHAKGGNAPEASATLFIDMDFVPAMNLQAENRMDRPEQTRDMLVRYYMTEGEDIVDRRVQKIVAEKMSRINKFMEPITEAERAEMPTRLRELAVKHAQECRRLGISG